MSPPPLVALQSATAVQSVIEILIDSHEGLVTVGERLQDRALKRYFFAESLVRANFIGQLESALLARGVSRFRDKGSTAAILHRTWARLKSKFVGGDHTLLVTAEQGEDAVTEIYLKATETYLPAAIREILTAQEAHIKLTHTFVKTARDGSTSVGKAAQNMVPAEDEILP
jgi:uncharacterized protein (TIGR02284 family)